MILKRNRFSQSGMFRAFPMDHDDMSKQLGRYFYWTMKNLDQNRWTNYQGIKHGPVPNQYKTKYPF